jgi:hypothetical protein
MPGLSEPNRKRLIKLLGMTGSSFDGEAMNALRMAEKILKENKLVLGQVIAPVGTEGPIPAPDWRDLVDDLLAARDKLSEWEIGFLTNLASWHGNLTPKQRAKLDDIINSFYRG